MLKILKDKFPITDFTIPTVNEPGHVLFLTISINPTFGAIV
jgi:hypothetical protein